MLWHLKIQGALMHKSYSFRSRRRFASLPGIALCCALFLLGGAIPARAAGAIWLVTNSSDSASLPGSLRHALANAVSGDQVLFEDVQGDAIFVNSTLTVPPGVAVGGPRDETDCGNYATPLANIRTESLLDPVFSLGAGAALHHVAIGGGKITARITGADADICGVALGQWVDGDGNTITEPPTNAALIIDGPRATIRRNFINQAMVVTINGSDSRIGDSLDGSGDTNRGGCGNQGRCAITVSSNNTTAAAQRVTIRDPFPRSLSGMPGSGIFGGDDDPDHANNWAQTPTILSAYTYDNFANVLVRGTANPRSLVDIYFDDHITLERQSPVIADASGVFTFTSTLPTSSIEVFAISTLANPQKTDRLGSSSEFSPQRAVTAPPPSFALQLAPTALGFTALVGDPPPAPRHLTLTVPSDALNLAWQTSVTTTDGLNWLSVAPASGSGDAILTVSVNQSGLAPGTYHGTIKAFEASLPSHQASASITLVVAKPLLSALGSVSNLSGVPSGPAHSGDLLRFTVAMTNVGTADVTNIQSLAFQLPSSVTVQAGSGAIQGQGTGFIATDSGFSGGRLTPGKSATYTLNVVVNANAPIGVAVFSMEVGADNIVTIPVVGRMRIVPTPGAAPQPVIWIPLAIR